jgi:2-polyprenyl-3-methyl-5-hydroxy-6-metoxy-1,4-benzoquinol methylase
VTEKSSLADLQGPAGNVSDKYGTKNPVVRFFVTRFLEAVDSAVGELAPSSLLDLGCGEGILTERIALSRPEAPAVGLDIAHPDLAGQWDLRRAANLAVSSRIGCAPLP